MASPLIAPPLARGNKAMKSCSENISDNEQLERIGHLGVDRQVLENTKIPCLHMNPVGVDSGSEKVLLSTK